MLNSCQNPISRFSTSENRSESIIFHVPFANRRSVSPHFIMFVLHFFFFFVSILTWRICAFPRHLFRKSKQGAPDLLDELNIYFSFFFFFYYISIFRFFCFFFNNNNVENYLIFGSQQLNIYVYLFIDEPKYLNLLLFIVPRKCWFNASFKFFLRLK